MSQVQQSTQYDLYLQEIEGIDDYWGPTFRLVDIESRRFTELRCFSGRYTILMSM